MEAGQVADWVNESQVCRQVVRWLGNELRTPAGWTRNSRVLLEESHMANDRRYNKYTHEKMCRHDNRH